MTMPKNSADAREAIADLRAKRVDLVSVIKGTADRRRGHAVAAEFGDSSARAALDKIDADEAQSRAALTNLDVAIDEMSAWATNLERQEADRRASLANELASAAIDEILGLDDEIDDLLEQARAKLEQRDALNRNPALSAARRRGRGTMMSERQIGHAIVSFFDRWTRWTAPAADYRTLERLADLDARELGRESPAMQARPPRALLPWERALQRSATDRGLPLGGTLAGGWPDAPRQSEGF